MALLYAHRGASLERPENTLLAYRRAVELGADALELDAHQSADGHVIVSHDKNARRMCGIDRDFARSTVAEIRSWDAGFGFRNPGGERPFADQGISVPTLDDVLEEFSDLPLNVDLKQAWPSMVPTTLHTLRRHEAEARVTVASFRWRTLLEVRVRGYRGPTSLSRPECVALLASRAAFKRLPLTGTAAQLPVRVGPLDLATTSTVRRCHEQGLRVDFWTINDLATAEKLLDLGVDGIMTDDPGTLAPLFGGQGVAT